MMMEMEKADSYNRNWERLQNYEEQSVNGMIYGRGRAGTGIVEVDRTIVGGRRHGALVFRCMSLVGGESERHREFR